MALDHGLAQRLRDAGLYVKEVDGWEWRGSESFHPIGAVTHHTAGPPDSSSSNRTPSLGIIVNGRPDLNGPLANTYLGYDRAVYVVAAGRANHAGTPDGGSCKGMTGNTSAWGLEVEHPGTFPLPADMAELAARIQAATIRGTAGADMVVMHCEWAPSRKIDIATAPSGSAHRDRVRHYLQGGDDVSIPPWYWDWSNWYLNTDRDKAERPPSAPNAIPAWAWDYNEEDNRIARNHGMTDGERDWISWKRGGEQGERPPVPDKIPERWWDDLSYVNAVVKAG